MSAYAGFHGNTDARAASMQGVVALPHTNLLPSSARDVTSLPLLPWSPLAIDWACASNHVTARAKGRSGRRVKQSRSKAEEINKMEGK